MDGDDIIVYEARYQPAPNLRDQHRKLYVITNISTGEDGNPFALCQKHFDQWDAKDKVLWRVVGESTAEWCSECPGGE